MLPNLQILRRCLLFMACLAAPVPGVALAQGKSVVERMMAQQNPCRALRVNLLGSSVALDRLDDLAVTSVEVSILRDEMIAEVLGRLSCSASSGSLAQGEIRASIRLFASLDLASCTPLGVTVSLSEISGSFGEMLLGLKPDLEAAMASELSRQIVAECRVITALP
jgi:hypothetical protein